jgi:aspartyl protease family protein
MLLGVSNANAQEVVLAGVFSGKALLVIDGGAPRTFAVGQQVGGVRLISVGRESAEIEIGGRRNQLTLGGQPVSVGARTGELREITLVADIRGHFSGAGSINGAGVRFLVDTGASLISMGPATAIAAGIDYRRGEQGVASTANGVVPVWRVRLRKVRLGDIALDDVEGLVVQTDMPAVLLGMSFLNRMEMKRDGSTMVLRQRY